MKLNEKLVELRKGKNLSQAELAEKIEVSAREVSKWEKGTTLPDAEDLKLLEDFFQTSLKEASVFSKWKTKFLSMDEMRMAKVFLHILILSVATLLYINLVASLIVSQVTYWDIVLSAVVFGMIAVTVIVDAVFCYLNRSRSYTLLIMFLLALFLLFFAVIAVFVYGALTLYAGSIIEIMIYFVVAVGAGFLIKRK